jgi:hypothetical protein
MLIVGVPVFVDATVPGSDSRYETPSSFNWLANPDVVVHTMSKLIPYPPIEVV